MTDAKPTTTNDDYLGDAVYIGRVASSNTNTNEFVLWTERWSEDRGEETHWMVLDEDAVEKLEEYCTRFILARYYQK